MIKFALFVVWMLGASPGYFGQVPASENQPGALATDERRIPPANEQSDEGKSREQILPGQPASRVDYIQVMTQTLLEQKDSEYAHRYASAGYPLDDRFWLARELAQDHAACLIDAIYFETAAQLLEAEPYLRFFANGHGSGPEVVELLDKIDLQRLTERWKPCLHRAYEMRGLESDPAATDTQ